MVIINIIDKLTEVNSFSQKSENESMHMTSETCYYALRPKEDLIDIKFEVIEDGDIVTQGVVLKNHILILFTTTEKHSIEYIRKTKKALKEYIESLSEKYIYTYTMREYIESINFLKWIGFYMSNRKGMFEKWVLEKR